MSAAPNTKGAAGAQDDEFEVIIDESLGDAGDGDGLMPIGDVQQRQDPPAQAGNDRLESDQRAEHGGDDDEGDSQPNGKLTPEQRREQRRLNRIRRKEYVNALEATVGTLSQRLQQLEQQVGRNAATTVEQQYREATDHVRRAEQIMQQAVEAGDGSKHVEAMRYRDEALAAARSLAPQVRQLRNGGAVQQQPQQQPDPELVRRATSWASRHSWYNAKGSEQDTGIIREIDAEVASEGFDPRTSDYWDELTDRARERLPHRFKVGERKGPAVGDRGEAPSPGRKQVRISPQMRAAMEEAGVWDDPKRRNKVLADHFRLQNQTR